MKKYCCFSLDTGVTIVGWGQLNAAFFFWARFLTFEPIYKWIDMWTAIMFTLRAIFFFIMRAKGDSSKAKMQYYEVNKGTMFGLLVSAIVTVTIKWLEWGSTWAAFPRAPFISWVLWAACQTLNWFLIKSYLELNRGWGTSDGNDDSAANAMIKKDDDSRTAYTANPID